MYDRAVELTKYASNTRFGQKITYQMTPPSAVNASLAAAHRIQKLPGKISNGNKRRVGRKPVSAKKVSASPNQIGVVLKVAVHEKGVDRKAREVSREFVCVIYAQFF